MVRDPFMDQRGGPEPRTHLQIAPTHLPAMAPTTSQSHFVNPVPEPEPIEPAEVPWTNTFHARTSNLSNFPVATSSYRATYRANSINRAKMGCVTNTTKSLNLLRAALQRNLNEEIHEVISKYLDAFFRPAVENIKANGPGDSIVSEHHLQSVCQKILEEAKKMYFVGLTSRNQQQSANHHHNWDSDHETVHAKHKSPATKRQRDLAHAHGHQSDSDSDDHSSNHPATHRSPGRPAKKKKKVIKVASNLTSRQVIANSVKDSGASNHKVLPASKSTNLSANDGVRRDGHRWNPARLSADTKFVLGSKANKALGFGMTRGRLYTKHADLFRYIGDQEDKTWLSEHGLMPPAGGRAYLLIKQDIEDLIATPEYKGMPGVKASDMGQGFNVPERMIDKMKGLMTAMRTDGHLDGQQEEEEETSREQFEGLHPVIAELELDDVDSQHQQLINQQLEMVSDSPSSMSMVATPASSENHFA